VPAAAFVLGECRAPASRCLHERAQLGQSPRIGWRRNGRPVSMVARHVLVVAPIAPPRSASHAAPRPPSNRQLSIIDSDHAALRMRRGETGEVGGPLERARRRGSRGIRRARWESYLRSLLSFGAASSGDNPTTGVAKFWEGSEITRDSGRPGVAGCPFRCAGYPLLPSPNSIVLPWKLARRRGHGSHQRSSAPCPEYGSPLSRNAAQRQTPARESHPLVTRHLHLMVAVLPPTPPLGGRRTRMACEF
jgi:hypothetical protein